MKTSTLVLAGAILLLATALIASRAIQTYYSPYHSCVRSYSGEPQDASRMCSIWQGGVR